MNVNKYKKLIVDFLEERMSANEFQTQYLKKFKEGNDCMDESLFEILNGVFESADCYWHECLPGQETPFEISEQQLRYEVHDALIKLNKLLDSI
ncbi:colicin immunity domain-containing protein [Kurthia sp. Dielmo]|uniref:colicin immunity domain-containing protein n=1 Tax=Kurthia sp. Dielmo TaxID=1033738 RepID=UPI001123F123|nr:colicin immunity domain-containing protein [Kurthia sp. Dielmo]